MICLTAIVIAEVLIIMCTGSPVLPHERATAVGLSVFAMHVLGDIPSPPLIGLISDRSSLASALLIVPIAVALAGLIWSYAAWRGEKHA